METTLAAFCFFCALLPAYLFSRNVVRFRCLPPASDRVQRRAVSVLIPARNEQQSIGPCVASVLSSIGVKVEVIVLDDQSEDDTAKIVGEISKADQRVSLVSSAALPTGWCGKQFACAQLAELAKHDVLVFMDADVRLSDDALARMDDFRNAHKIDLLSGFPRQETNTLAERMLIPLIHFVLLGFLSLRRMRNSGDPAFGAGCGQLFMTGRRAYKESGGHGAIRSSLHDGLKLPRAYRRNGLVTDVFDASDLATCRMYRNASEVWHGLKKNAIEGVATAGLIVPVTLLLICGQVLPFLLAVYGLLIGLGEWKAWTLIGITLLLAWLPRFVAAQKYRQSMLGACLHPISIVVFLAIQWAAFLGSFSRRSVSWKGRPYPTG